MKCDLCHGNYVEKNVSITLQRHGATMAIENVPAKVCDVCGDRLFSPSTVQEVERILDEEPQATAPLYRFPERVA